MVTAAERQQWRQRRRQHNTFPAFSGECPSRIIRLPAHRLIDRSGRLSLAGDCRQNFEAWTWAATMTIALTEGVSARHNERRSLRQAAGQRQRGGGVPRRQPHQAVSFALARWFGVIRDDPKLAYRHTCRRLARRRRGRPSARCIRDDASLASETWSVLAGVLAG